MPRQFDGISVLGKLLVCLRIFESRLEIHLEIGGGMHRYNGDMGRVIGWSNRMILYSSLLLSSALISG